MNQMADEENLLRSMRAFDQAALAEAYDTYSPRLYRYTGTCSVMRRWPRIAWRIPLRGCCGLWPKAATARASAGVSLPHGA